ncbi:hypothetical protein ACFQH2_06840 [Natronoarchaeum sp. GCM10025703]|uniref:hypothetical protein n=1 Tax=Natronoarchaeum sp. GCM10025703 TaxID=3252685 RepID=UPI003609290A
MELEAWVTSVALRDEDYNTPRSNRSAARPDDLDSDADGVEDEADVRNAAVELETQLLGQTNEAAEAISKRSARTGRNPETNKPITERFEEMMGTIDRIQATLERCSNDVCVTVLKNADHRTKLVQQAQRHVGDEEWDQAATAVDEVRDIVEGDIERLEDYNSPRSNRSIAAPDGVRTDDEADEIVRYLDDAPVVAGRFTVCLPDADVPGGNGSLAAEVTPQRFIDYLTGRAAADSDGNVYAWGSTHPPSAVAEDSDEDDDTVCSEAVNSSVANEILCKSNHLEADISGPVVTGGGLRTLRTDVGVTVVNDPPEAAVGPSVLVCPVDGEAYEPSDLSGWGSESGARSETPTVVCQVWVQPPECPYPLPALLYVKRCRSDEQLVYTGGWVLDDAALYPDSVTALTIAGGTQVVGVEAVVDGECCLDYNDALSRSLSTERARRGARLDLGSVSSLVEARVLSEDGGGNCMRGEGMITRRLTLVLTEKLTELTVRLPCYIVRWMRRFFTW